MRSSVSYPPEIFPSVSIIVIGRNEQKKLDSCFKAIQNMNYPSIKIELIYVDSDSTDNSVSIAKKYTPKIFIEKNIWLTAALARNRGIMEAQHEIIHFIDGDAEIGGDYLKHAISIIGKDKIAAVTGVARETGGYSGSIVSSLAQRNVNIGYADGSALAGGGTFLKKVLLEIRGYDERIARGEESELGIRLMDQGYKIYCIDKVIFTHKFSFSLSEYVGKFFMIGKTFAYVSFLPNLNYFFVQTKKLALSNIIQNILVLFFLGMAITIKRADIIAYIFLAHVAWVIAKDMLFKKISKMSILIGDSLLVTFSKPIVFFGQISFFLKYCFVFKKTNIFERNHWVK